MSDFVRATAKDAAAVHDLVRSAYAKWIPIIGREPIPMTADYGLAIRAHMIDLMFVDNELCGLVELVPEPDCVLILNVAVRPDRAGKGYGRTLMAHAKDVARALGRGRLRLFTNKLMVDNIALYRKLGYTFDREERTPDGRDAVHMSMTL